jgi:hypothetical protein
MRRRHVSLTFGVIQMQGAGQFMHMGKTLHLFFLALIICLLLLVILFGVPTMVSLLLGNTSPPNSEVPLIITP